MLRGGSCGKLDLLVLLQGNSPPKVVRIFAQLKHEVQRSNPAEAAVPVVSGAARLSIPAPGRHSSVPSVPALLRG